MAEHKYRLVIIISVITFLFLLSVTNGEIRAYIILGIIAGFVLNFLLLSRFNILILKCVLGLISKCLKLFSSGFYWVFSKIDTILSKFFKNSLICFKKGLKKGKYLLYTK